MTLKEQAQKFVDGIMENRLDKKEFDKWVVDVNKKEVVFIIRSKNNNYKDEIYCVSPQELYYDLDVGADKSIVEGTIDSGVDCDACPWKEECE